MTTSPLTKKLLLKPGYRAAVLNPPTGYLERLQPLPDGAELQDTPGEGLDFVQVFARDAAELGRFWPAARRAIKPDGLLWVCYPKGGARAGTDLNRDILWRRLSQEGLAGVAQVAIDETWSAMRFRTADRVVT